MINIVFSSIPHDGLFFYSYEHCCFLNDNNIQAQMVIFEDANYSKNKYIKMLESKYNNVQYHKLVFIDNFSALVRFRGTNFMLGSSHLWHTYKKIKSSLKTMYSERFKLNLRICLSNDLIYVHNDNFPDEEVKALEYFKPRKTQRLVDSDIYPNTEGIFYRKFVYFKDFKKVSKFDNKTFFNASNEIYYKSVKKYLKTHRVTNPLILVSEYVDDDLRKYQTLTPVQNLQEKFDKYVYLKNYFDPAPRFLQECFYYHKEVIYAREKDLQDGGKIYFDLLREHGSISLENKPYILDILK